MRSPHGPSTDHLAHEGYCVYTFTTNVPVGILDELGLHR
ncbi:triacylglycerol lipase precursor [Cutibacterium acnes JCM 18920]|nr:triacylglycerol lipase precursor [Cutibacterium acnes JCM 18920]